MDPRFVVAFINKYLASVKRDHWSKQKLNKNTHHRLDQIRKYALKHSPYYQQHHKGYENAPLHKLPPVNKQMMMDNFDQFVTDPHIKLEELQKFIKQGNNQQLFKNKYRVLTTSGSTGSPGIFLYNIREWAEIGASFSKSIFWVGIKINPFKPHKRAIVASTSPWHLSNQLGNTIKELKLPVLKIPANQPLEKIVEQLNKYQPHELVAYASMAAILTDEQKEKRLNISPLTVMTTSEVLTKKTRNKIQNTWNTDPINTYGITEGGCLGGQCKYGSLHLLEDNSIFEIVDDNYHPVPAGHYGTRILLTSLYHRTQPLIRYEISDSIKAAHKKCKCGKTYTTIEDIQGRSEQILELKGTHDNQVKIHPVVFHEVMDTQPIKLWQVIKTSNKLEVLVEKPAKDFSTTKLAKDIQQAINHAGGITPKVTVKEVKSIKKEPSGKLPYIKVTTEEWHQ